MPAKTSWLWPTMGGVPGIVRHGETGFLLDPDDLDGLTAALVSLSEIRS